MQRASVLGMPSPEPGGSYSQQFRAMRFSYHIEAGAAASPQIRADWVSFVLLCSEPTPDAPDWGSVAWRCCRRHHRHKAQRHPNVSWFLFAWLFHW
uniref:Uncharacterized protein n=1 Tax=Sphaerodactylus townsendi TaxID=933632 RepID=A0ACB8ENQ2_9SAUR